MNIVINETKIFDYSELNQEAKIKVKYLYSKMQNSDALVNNIRLYLKENYQIENLFPINYVAGEEFTESVLIGYINFNELTKELKKVFLNSLNFQEHKFINTLGIHSYIIFSNSSFTCDKNMTSIDVCLSGDRSKFTNSAVHKLIKNVRTWYNGICDWCTQETKNHFYDTQDKEEDYLIGYCKSKNLKFLEDGSLYKQNQTTNLRYIENTKDISDNLKHFRLKNNLTQEETAKKIGCERSTYSRYEDNTRMPSIFSLIAISKVFKIDIRNLILKNNAVKFHK